MSDNTGDESIFTKIKNLAAYKINNAVSDPNAEKYAIEIAKKKKEKEEKEKKLAAQINITANIIKASPNQFNLKRFLNKILDETTKFFKIVFFQFVALMLSMIIANEMIVYSVPVRIIFFIFTFIVCFLTPPLCIILALFYILKGAYSYYINNMTGKTPIEKMKIMPTIFTLLPITMYKPESSFLKFFYYPFTYPKSDISAAELPKIMDKYWKELNESFKDLDQIVSNNPSIFSDQLKNLENKLLKKLHDPAHFNPVPLESEASKASNASKAPVAETPVAEIPKAPKPIKSSFLSSLLPKTKPRVLPQPDRHEKIVEALAPKTISQSTGQNDVTAALK